MGLSRRLYTDASHRGDLAAVAVVLQEGTTFRLLHVGAVWAGDNNEAERAAFLKALRLAPQGATVYTDSGHVQALLRGRVTPGPREASWLRKCKAVMRAKGLGWDFTGGRKRRHDGYVRKGHRLADKAAKELARLLPGERVGNMLKPCPAVDKPINPCRPVSSPS
ncbi:hypothetical protein [Thermus caldifontis]|uniref:hypothetical protein n=1 Tax=Thermus caldifontis TaxID=1930763 RepID=UPI0013B3F115|nr:hypothetical protein [Thermus caldifontis]